MPADKDPQHFEKLWGILPQGSPFHSIGKEKLREIVLPPDRAALIKIDPTRKHAYSLILSEFFSESPFEEWITAIHTHHDWLARNSPVDLAKFQKQLLKCADNLAAPDRMRERASDTIEYLEAQEKGLTTRDAIRKVAREHDPSLFDDSSDANRDLLKKITLIYKIGTGPPHRPKGK